MIGKSGNILFFLSLLLLLTGCRSTPKMLRTLELTEKESGQTVQLKVGESVQISLAANPTTGYQWSFFREDPSRAMETASDGEFTPARSALCGAPGTFVYTLKAARPGCVTVTGYYFRPWEKCNQNIDHKVHYVFEIAN